ncbi:hypothetical protein [Paenibacillus marinisediminis]
MKFTPHMTNKIQSHHNPLLKSKGFHPFMWLREGMDLNAWLTMLGLLMVITLLATCIGLLVDQRVIAGAPGWIKPAKFAISFSVYSFTFVWLLSFLRRWKKIVKVLTPLISIGVLIDMALIILQVIRGVRSHFNVATPFDDMVYRIMGIGVTMIFLAAFLTAILLLFERRTDFALIWSLRLSLAIMLFGMFIGFLMLLPTTAQLQAYNDGHLPLIIGAHSVGIPDGGPGLPFLGWSTTGGDLRIAHFVGLHALQVLPFVGLFFSEQRVPRLSTVQRVALVWAIGLGYAGLVGSLYWQALRGQSLIAPDGLTWISWVVVVGLTLVMSGLIILHAQLSKNQ